MAARLLLRGKELWFDRQEGDGAPYLGVYWGEQQVWGGVEGRFDQRCYLVIEDTSNLDWHRGRQPDDKKYMIELCHQQGYTSFYHFPSLSQAQQWVHMHLQSREGKELLID